MIQGILMPVITPFDERGLVDEPKRFPKWETQLMPEDAREALRRDLRDAGCLE